MMKTEEISSLPTAVEPASAGEAMSVDVKTETELPNLKSESEVASPQERPAAAGNCAPTNTKRNLRKKASTSPPSLEEGSLSKKSSPSPAAITTTSRKPTTLTPQLVGNLPLSREAALKTFNEITCNNYQNKSLGRSKEMFESMTCDCVYEHGVDRADDACGPYSNCINRLTQVECLADDCRCQAFCQNQRFQKRQYANIEIVLTELKGYGLRAEEDIPKDAFIYEYVGDVVSPASFKKRMRDYAVERIEHFYFMMLQKDEFIDATKSGGIGRFANHSCNPNCYVAKWTIGGHVRMGIFSKRDVQKHEELTFNYNVDRYGHQAQTCYCGEPNCVGFIGGKTQTDIVTMDDLYLDALGITDEDDVAALKGTKKKKGKKIDDLDFMPKIKPVIESEVPKVVQAIRQTQSKKVLLRLLNRIKITEDQAALRQMMRLRGYSVMKIVLDEHTGELELMEMVLRCLKTWPLMNRNKVDDSVINGSVEEVLKRHESESLKTLGQELLDHWKSLPVYSRIPKRVYQETEKPSYDQTSQIYNYAEEMELKRQNQMREGKRARIAPQLPSSSSTSNQQPLPAVQPSSEPKVDLAFAHKQSVRNVIANAEAKVEAEKKAAAEAAEAEAKAAAEKAERIAKRKAKVASRKSITEEEKTAMKEKRLMKLVGAVVVKCMSKYAKSMPREPFKKYAKELTQIIAEKEKKSSSYKEGRLENLSEEKVTKIKKFSKDYIAKVVRKLEKSGCTGSTKRPRHEPPPSTVSMTPTNATASSSTHTPNSADGGAMDGVEMTVEEAMDLDPDSGTDDDQDAEGEDDDDVEEIETGITPLLGGWSTRSSPIQVDATCLQPDEDMCDSGWESTDPRRRMDLMATEIHG